MALCDSLIDLLSDHINSIDPAIKFTREEEDNKTIPMLDTLTKRNDEGQLSFTVYRKPTHTDQYLQFASNQPLQHKLGVVSTLYHRCMVLCSEEDSKIKEIEHLKKVLSVSGYTKATWNTATAARDPTSRKNPTTADTNRTKGSISLPYVGPMTEAIARNIRRAGVTTHIRPFNTIRGRLVHPKDKLDRLDQAGVVYRIACNDCDATYVGETERKLNTRFKEHHRSSSPVGQHMEDRRHSVDETSVSVLHKESDWYRRGVAEAIFVQQESPSLNRGRERHILPAIYNELLPSSRDVTSESHVTGVAHLAVQRS